MQLNKLMEGEEVNSSIVTHTKQRNFEFLISVKRYPELVDTGNNLHIGYFIGMISNSIKKCFNTENYSIENIDFLIMLTIPEHSETQVSLVLDPLEGGVIEFKFYSRQSALSNWVLNAHGTINLDVKKQDIPDINLLDIVEKIKNTYAHNYYRKDFYEKLSLRGLHIGPSAQWVDQIWIKEGEVLARFRLAERKEESIKTGILDIHPGILESCAQLFNDDLAYRELDKVFFVSKLAHCEHRFVKKTQNFWCIVKYESSLDSSMRQGSFIIFNDEGNVLIRCNLVKMYSVSIKSTKNLSKKFEKGSNLDFKNHKLIQIELQKTLSNLLEIEPIESINLEESIHDLGVASIMVMPLKEAIEKIFEVTIPVQILINGPNILELSAEIISLKGKTIIQIDEQKDGVFNIKPEKYRLDKALWINKSKAINDDIKFRLFCFPYGGAGASLYRTWQENLPSEIIVSPIQLPGRENRINENPIDNIKEMIDVLELILSEELSIPYAIYGHSFGALIAFHLANRLIKIPQNKKNLKLLLVGGYSAPSIYPNPFYLKILENCKSLGFTNIPSQDEISQFTINDIQELIKLFVKNSISHSSSIELIRLIMSDVKVLESQTYSNNDVIDIPIIGFHGEKDDRVRLNEINEWKKSTVSDFRFHVLKGDHFFLHKDQCQKELLSTILGEILSLGIDLKTETCNVF